MGLKLKGSMGGKDLLGLHKGGMLGVIEPGIDLEGKMTVGSGTVRVNSRFKGEIGGEGTVVVAERGDVEAEIKAKAVVVVGKVKGTVYAAERLEIREGGMILGDIHTPVLCVEAGGSFDGQCHMPSQAPASVPITMAASKQQPG